MPDRSDLSFEPAGEEEPATESGDAATMRHALYELCVQSTKHVVPFLRAVHQNAPTMLGEDFAGTAALSHRWVNHVEGGSAVAVDLDGEALRHRGEDERIESVQGDVLACSLPADVLFVGNFSIGYLHTRAALVAYLRHALSRLEPGGVFVCDTYGGESAFLIGEVHRDHYIAGDDLPEALVPHRGKRVRYTWEQREADPLTARVTDVCSFRVIDGRGTIELELPDAFVYRWRLWSVPEIREALDEAGYASVEVYDKTAEAIDQDGNAYVRPVEDGSELDDSFIVMVVGRA